MPAGMSRASYKYKTEKIHGNCISSMYITFEGYQVILVVQFL